MHIGDHLKNGRIWKDNIKMHLRKIGCNDADLTEWKFCNCSMSYLTALLSAYDDESYKIFLFSIHMLPQ